MMMADIEEIIEQEISSVTGCDPVEMSDGTIAYTAIIVQFSDKFFIISADPDTDQIVSEVQIKTNGLDKNHPVAGHEAMVGKRIDNMWLCRNVKNYRDVLMLALDGLQPSIGFIAEASRISLMLVKPVIRTADPRL